jgi:hypothetical protein
LALMYETLCPLTPPSCTCALAFIILCLIVCSCVCFCSYPIMEHVSA